MGALESFEDAGGVGWEVYRDESSGLDYYYNTETQKTTWKDPRRLRGGGAAALRQNLPHFTGLGLLFIGLLFVAIAVRVRWLRRHRPGLLETTEKKKVRRPKRPKANRSYTHGSRNRMSQDGKGGRSANS